MKKDESPKGSATAAKPDRIPLDEFCARLSREDKRVSLIGGFHFDERKNGRVKDTHEAYSQRFAQYAQRPIR
jgi:hypothetical protein